MDALHLARRRGMEPNNASWNIQLGLVRYLEEHWQEPDEGIWETRGPRQNFTHSKIMAWVAVDRAIKAVERFGLEGDIEKWTKLRDRIHAEVCEKGFNPEIQSFTQAFGTRNVDASLLMIPLVGFLPPKDPRVIGTIRRIERDLLHDGFVLRYRTEETSDGLPGSEGAFLPCSYWLCDNYVLIGEHEKARDLFERLAGLVNDVGLLSEEYDPKRKRLLGNFPQALSHISLINSAFNLSGRQQPARERSELDPL